MDPVRPGNRTQKLWDRLVRWPGGRGIFSFFLGRIAPYTGSIRPRVLDLRAGYARVAMGDRRAVRNHLDSIHAIALLNLAEVTSGLALNYGLPGHARAILTHLSIDYLKKARGDLVAEASVPIPDGLEREEIELETLLRDAEGSLVARATARWLVGPHEEPTSAA